MRRIWAVLAAVALTGCSAGTSTAPQTHEVTLVTHDSFVVKDGLLDEFQKATGITVKQIASGDAGELTNKLVLTKANPIGDVAFGVDSTFASRALAEGVFAEYASPEATKGAQRYQADTSNRLHAVDVGDVCLNIDPAKLGGVEPASYEDLTDPKFKDKLVVENPATSSPGLAFLLGTIAKFGENGWQEYWTKLKANGVKVVSGWEEAYNQDFKADRPIVVSYASSPSAEGGKTKAVLSTCYRQVEYAGVLSKAKNAADAQKVLDFLLGEKFQAQVAEQMYVYPSREGVALPESWAKDAPLPASPQSLPADKVKDNREAWVEQWRKLVQG
ncbi:ABC transporter substrate-binding protein [Lentzea aerocolonigenes]|uniref:ABC transporter substrate-binding protein n=1 Tax=Lentzea aerocolonigenes TaxID=68170 RepID=A0A0F0HBL9_LENAE|nr:thiamine ABC transporter substrate-binding protein [Lentzea aerocolonigenes]KJK52261.1 ABC transporter substrate-binding protein [Lentzea aerocolonigenes]